MVGLRTRADSLLDWMRFRLDVFPQLEYQPLPWLGLHRARRSAGTESRWDAIRPMLESRKAASLLDVGSNVGWFSLSAAQMGLSVVAVEVQSRAYRTLLYAIRRLQLNRIGVLVLSIGPDTVRMMPATDALLFLSVWHHLVRIHGLEAASDILRALWDRTDVLFFDTGESEMPERYGLPAFEPDPRTWIEAYLGRVCEGGTVRYLGLHDAFAPDGTVCQRNLFAVEK